jgi:hypothetical protein
LLDEVNNLKKNHNPSKCRIKDVCKDCDELILAITREILKHKDLVEFSIINSDQLADRSKCTYEGLNSSVCTF